jgi:peptide/nickel transport system permease protein
MVTANRRSATGESNQEAAVTPAAGFRYQETSMGRLILRQFLRHRLAVVSTIVFLIIVASAICAPLLVRYDPAYIDPTVFDEAPSHNHPLGTDRVGRDVLSRLVYGGRVSLSVGVVAVLIFVGIGILLGSLAGYYGKGVDSAISRFIDIVLSFPQLMLILVLVSLLGPGLRNIMLVIGLLGWPQVARIVRGEFLRLRVQDFVMAARVVGSTNRRIIIRHFLPNAMGPILVAATFGVASSILTESALSFLGLGVQPPTPSWGQMLNEAQSLTILESKPWLWVPPGIMILISVLSINFIGDGLRDALDPQLRR